MRTLEILGLLLRIAALALAIAARIRMARLARFDGVLLWSVVALCDGIAILLAWALVINLSARVGFLPPGPLWFFREFAGLAYLYLGWAFVRMMLATGGGRR